MKTHFISGCVVVACAEIAGASFVGGAFVTDAAWNAAASAAVGQDVTVFRLFMAFDDPKDTMINVFNARFSAAGDTLYQEPILGATTTPPSTAAVGLVPALAWDTYVSAGALRQPSVTATGDSLIFTNNGLASALGPGGASWGVSDPTTNEGRSKGPGGVDVNGDAVIPASFSPAYTYTFYGQFTVLGAVDLTNYNPIFDGGFIYSDRFVGDLGMTFNDGLGQGNTEQLRDIQITVPAPGAAGVLLLGFGGVATRRRR